MASVPAQADLRRISLEVNKPRGVRAGDRPIGLQNLRGPCSGHQIQGTTTMTDSQGTTMGRVVAIWRYPVKSMKGEELETAVVTGRGLLGDRAYALVDSETGKVASAKNPRRWPNLFDFRASFVEPPDLAGPIPPASITLPDGERLGTDHADVEGRLSRAVGRPVRLARSGAEGAVSEGYWPDHEWLAHRDRVFPVELANGTFFDGSMVHLITTATLDHLHALAPEGRFDVRRFRPNFLIEPAEGAGGFVENGWIGRTIQVGDVLLDIERPCPRCVMTTLAQDDLPKDPAILRTVVRANGGNVGVYATVARTGRVRRGDAVGPG